MRLEMKCVELEAEVARLTKLVNDVGFILDTVYVNSWADVIDRDRKIRDVLKGQPAPPAAHQGSILSGVGRLRVVSNTDGSCVVPVCEATAAPNAAIVQERVLDEIDAEGYIVSKLRADNENTTSTVRKDGTSKEPAAAPLSYDAEMLEEHGQPDVGIQPKAAPQPDEEHDLSNNKKFKVVNFVCNGCEKTCAIPCSVQMQSGIHADPSRCVVNGDVVDWQDKMKPTTAAPIAPTSPTTVTTTSGIGTRGLRIPVADGEGKAAATGDPCEGCESKDGNRCEYTYTYRFDTRSIPKLPCEHYQAKGDLQTPSEDWTE